MAEKKLNWGILSTARINRALMKPLRGSARNQLLAVASRNLTSASTYAREQNIPRAYGGYEDLLADADIDVIYNPLPNHLHAEWSVKALRAGKHVLCEKPLALTLADVDAMSAASKETGKIIAEAFMYRHHAQTLKVKEMIDSGALGKLQLIKGAFTFTLSRQGNFRYVKEFGGGSIWDVGCYPISYARMLAGAEPLEVFGWQTASAAGCDDSFVGQMRFPNGVYAQFDSGFTSPFRAYMEVIGSEAALYIPTPFKPSLKNEVLLKRGGEEEKIIISGGELYSGEVEDLCDAILLGKPPRVSLTDSRANVAAILALIESAQSGKPVLLNS
ncbi:MAG: Gfo/Idh/MocA family oxidoreductase [Anaerolineales bacterium]